MPSNMQALRLANIDGMTGRQLTEWSKDASDEELTAIARSPRAGKALLRTLSHSSSLPVRKEVAKRSDLPKADRVVWLTRETSGSVLNNLLSRPLMPEDLDMLTNGHPANGFAPGAYDALMAGFERNAAKCALNTSPTAHARVVNWVLNHSRPVGAGCAGTLPVTARRKVDAAKLAAGLAANGARAASVVAETAQAQESWAGLWNHLVEQAETNLAVRTGLVRAHTLLTEQGSRPTLSVEHRASLHAWTKTTLDAAAMASDGMDLAALCHDRLDASQHESVESALASAGWWSVQAKEIWQALAANPHLQTTWLDREGLALALATDSLDTYLHARAPHLAGNSWQMEGFLKTSAECAKDVEAFSAACGHPTQAGRMPRYTQSHAVAEIAQTVQSPEVMTLASWQLLTGEAAETGDTQLAAAMLEHPCAGSWPEHTPVSLLKYAQWPGCEPGRWLAGASCASGRNLDGRSVAMDMLMASFTGTCEQLVNAADDII